MLRSALTAIVWVAALLSLVVGGLIATIFVTMPTALGPSEMIEAGIEPWTTALMAGAGFVGLVIVAVLGLALWHSTRLRALGLLITFGEVVAVAWAAAKVYIDYF